MTKVEGNSQQKVEITCLKLVRFLKEFRQMTEQAKSVVSVSEMARMVGLSRQRFHQLRGNTFPQPDFDPSTNRPFYNQEKQNICLSVRQRNCGIDGKPILFYARRCDVGVRRTKQKPTTPKTKTNQHTHIVESLKALGLQSATSSQVEAAVKNLFPDGTKSVDEAEIVRTVFLHLQSTN